jgi:glutaredoxin-dependent peroxiredoxin
VLTAGVVLPIGHRIPDFSLFDTDGKERKLPEFLQNDSLTLIIFPFAFSGISDRELCMFRDNLAAKSLKGTVVGISVDSVFTLRIFNLTYELGFSLLSDFNKKVVKAFDVLEDSLTNFGYKGVAKSSIFVVDRKGVLRYRWIAGNPSEEAPYEEIANVASKLG